jgi:hypothetical protein
VALKNNKHLLPLAVFAIVCVCVCVCGIGDWTQSSTTGPHPKPFYFIFQIDRVSHFCLDCTGIIVSYLCLLSSQNLRCTPPSLACLWDRVLSVLIILCGCVVLPQGFLWNKVSCPVGQLLCRDLASAGWFTCNVAQSHSWKVGPRCWFLAMWDPP